MSSHRRDLERFLHRYGLRIVPGPRHLRIVDAEGQTLCPLSQTPSCPHVRRQAIRMLVKRGALPRDAIQEGPR